MFRDTATSGIQNKLNNQKVTQWEKCDGGEPKVKRHQQLNIDELRQTLEYAEALILLERKRKLDHYQTAINAQLTALQRLSKAAVTAARNDMDTGP